MECLARLTQKLNILRYAQVVRGIKELTEELLKVLRLDRKKIYSYTVDFGKRTILIRRYFNDKGIILPLTKLPIREEQIER